MKGWEGRRRDDDLSGLCDVSTVHHVYHFVALSTYKHLNILFIYFVQLVDKLRNNDICRPRNVVLFCIVRIKLTCARIEVVLA
jgi:hypothetical protein